MTIEASLANIQDILQKIHTAIASGAQVAATAADSKPAETKAADKPKAADKTKAADKSADKPKEVTWKDNVLPVLMKINGSTAAGHGRDGLLKVLAQFGLEGKRVPDLEALGKHADVLDYATKVLEGKLEEATAGDDLGL